MKPLLALGLAAVLASSCGGGPAPRAEAPVPAGLAVVDGAGARVLQRLPAGIASPDARRLYWLGGGRLHVSDTGSGAELSSVPVAQDSVLAGLSPNGDTLVLTDPGGSGRRFVAYATRNLGARPRVADLTRSFEFDAVSPGGSNLYLIERKEQLGAGTYSVTVYDYSRGSLCRCTVIDKTEPGTTLMKGTRVMSVPAADGSTMFTLYQGGGETGAFVHALSLRDPIAWCVDLPAAGDGSGWQIGLSASGSELLAVNLGAGLAAGADVSRAGTKPAFTKLSRFEPTPGPAAGRRGLLAAPDGHNLLVLGPEAVVALDAFSLRPRATLLAGLRPVALGSSPDGQWQFALGAGGQVARLNPLQPSAVPFATGLEAPLLLVR